MGPHELDQALTRRSRSDGAQRHPCRVPAEQHVLNLAHAPVAAGVFLGDPVHTIDERSSLR
ncbi:hypothetical protein CLV92_10947 [Kineococcus xinjiangensis]|uniref:Uncharacterized protein n=1 Tax=Kineococcus xinjiangensis TaxID=512762 RepID=A0A2S6IHV4_9ACTN|nr:hypothetical protein CLV92_10947 [Kineococcus xinjiangensis]